MPRTLIIALAVIAALLPIGAIVVCAALIALGLALPGPITVRTRPASSRLQPVLLLALALFRAPPSLLA